MARRGARSSHICALESEGRVRSDKIEHAPTRHEAAMLGPDLSKLGDGAGTDVIRAELGYGDAEPLLRYLLT